MAAPEGSNLHNGSSVPDAVEMHCKRCSSPHKANDHYRQRVEREAQACKREVTWSGLQSKLVAELERVPFLADPHSTVSAPR